MVNVIGGGPAGSFFSSLASDSVNLFEEHKEIGKPVACTGIMTSAIKDLIKLDDSVVVNHLDIVKVIGPNVEFDINLKNKEIVVDRAGLDKFLVEKALSNNVKLYLEHKFIGSKDGYSLFKNKNSVKKYKQDILVGADGPGSLVARENGLMARRRYWVGKQYSVKMKTELNVFKVYFGDVPDFFGWVVPESENMARVGVASEKNVNTYFDLLVKKLNISKNKFVECQAGPIPMYDPKCVTSKDNVYLLGDAAGMVKATTGGGLVYGMRGAKCLADCLKNGKNYEKEWRKSFGKELWFHLQVRNFLNKLKPGDYDKLIYLLNKTDLGSYNRDYPLKKLNLFLKPGLMMFVLKNLLKKNI